MTLSVEAREMLRVVNVATLTNCLLSRGLRNIFLHGISPVAPTTDNMVGEAFTMRFIPAREDIDNMAAYARPDHVQRRAIEECPAGSVLVIDSRGDARAASAGDLLIARLKARGAAGIVTDGGFRDVAGVANTGLPSYQKQTASPASPIIHHAADLNLPIGCAGVAVYPGDIVVGDREGVVIFPAKFAEEVAREAHEATLYEEFADVEIRRGRSIFGLFPATEESRAQYQEWRKLQNAKPR
ncbi:MAG: ribonuclease activity regulator RraA [Rhizobiales bacterium]|nr:ribonuclease activity regulator RraA [Hyphomicrobiales bacterium]